MSVKDTASWTPLFSTHCTA